MKRDPEILKKHQVRVNNLDQYREDNPGTSIKDAAKHFDFDHKDYSNSKMFLKRYKASKVKKNKKAKRESIDHQARVSAVIEHSKKFGVPVVKACKDLKITTSAYYTSAKRLSTTKEPALRLREVKEGPELHILESISALPGESELTEVRSNKPLVIIYGHSHDVMQVLEKCGLNLGIRG